MHSSCGLQRIALTNSSPDGRWHQHIELGIANKYNLHEESLRISQTETYRALFEYYNREIKCLKSFSELFKHMIRLYGLRPTSAVQHGKRRKAMREQNHA
ncbi:hypothetical protein AVEN_4648-1 [Araneus ventricosus]|uniref:Uncharacterized protein n=1 Tax=Araneus ventricosus TaxID=182803 RepID=A0A4Y2VDP7_ARAVE|nr:hypothetical protein AVEN_4648-1 [Araneus ventricosus]